MTFVKSILFVCSGNIFRSVAAEYALKRELDSLAFDISSAGTVDAPNAVVREDVASYLLKKGLDVSKHKRRTLTHELVKTTDLVIPMDREHQEILLHNYSVNSKIYTEESTGIAKPLPDLDEFFALEDRFSEDARKYVYDMLDLIVSLAPELAKKLTLQYS